MFEIYERESVCSQIDVDTVLTGIGESHNNLLASLFFFKLSATNCHHYDHRDMYTVR